MFRLRNTKHHRKYLANHVENGALHFAFESVTIYTQTLNHSIPIKFRGLHMNIELELDQHLLSMVGDIETPIESTEMLESGVTAPPQCLTLRC